MTQPITDVDEVIRRFDAEDYLLDLGTAGPGVPSGEDVLGDHERRIRPAQRGARRRDLFLA